MATTYLTLVNQLLKGSNESVLTSGNFSSAVGVQDYAKDIINRVYLEICAEEEQWPFLASAESNANEPFAGNTVIETVAGTRWYLIKTGATDIRDDFSKVDWESFTSTTEGVSGAVTPFEYENLEYIPFNQWYDSYNEQENADAGGEQNFGLPRRVIASLDGRYFGISPIPDKAYKIFFTAWIQPTELSAHDDTILIPTMYTPMLLSKARYYLYMFKKDYQEATLALRIFDTGMRNMRRNLIGRQSDYMRDDWFVRRRF